MKTVKLTNGVSYGALIKITSEDVSAGSIVVEFVGNTGNEPNYPLAFAVTPTGTSTVSSFTAEGAKVTIQGTFVENDIIHVIACRGIEA